MQRITQSYLDYPTLEQRHPVASDQNHKHLSPGEAGTEPDPVAHLDQKIVVILAL